MSDEEPVIVLDVKCEGVVLVGAEPQSIDEAGVTITGRAVPRDPLRAGVCTVGSEVLLPNRVTIRPKHGDIINRELTMVADGIWYLALNMGRRTTMFLVKTADGPIIGWWE